MREEAWRKRESSSCWSWEGDFGAREVSPSFPSCFFFVSSSSLQESFKSPIILPRVIPLSRYLFVRLLVSAES